MYELTIIGSRSLRAINHTSSTDLVKGITVTSNIQITHQQFADDTMLFGAAKEKEAR